MSVTTQPNDSSTITSVSNPSEPTFEEFAATMPETAQGFLDAATIPNGPPGSAEDVTGSGFLDDSIAGVSETPLPEPRKLVNISKKMRKAMNRFKGKVAQVPIMWFHTQAKAANQPLWELDEEEKELIQDSIDTVFEVLDVEVEIQPLAWKLTSIWWVIAYPIAAFGFLFLTKKSLTQVQPDEIQE